MVFKSKFSQEEIYDEIIKGLPDMMIEQFVKENFSLRAKYGVLNRKNFRYNRERCLDAILSTYQSNKIVKDGIITIWDKLSKIQNELLRDCITIEDLRKYEQKRRETIDTVLFCTILWVSKEEEKNKLGDEIYTKYKERKEAKELEEHLAIEEAETLKENEESEESVMVEEKEEKVIEKFDEEESKEVVKAKKKKGKEKVKATEQKDESKEDMKEVDKKGDYKNEIMSMNLLECIENLTLYKGEIEGLEKQLKEKEENLSLLKEQVNKTSKNDFKKEITALNKGLLEGFNVVKQENLNLKKMVADLKKQNESLSNELVKQNKLLANLVSSENKELKKILVETQNAIKGALIEDNKKLLVEMKRYILEEALEEFKKEPVKVKEAKEESEFIKEIEKTTIETFITTQKTNKASDDILTQPFFDEEDFSSLFE